MRVSLLEQVSSLPAARYECSYRVETDYVESDLAIQFPPIIALPTGATNVRIKSPWEIMFIDEWYGTVGNEGKISIFKPFPIFDADNYAITSYQALKRLWSLPTDVL